MEFGIMLPTRADSWKVVQRAEALGASHAWFYDTALVNAEIFVAMGAAAVKTERIILATGVITPSNRIAPVTASGLAALNVLAPGRVAFGVGTGFTARRTMDMAAMKLADMERYIIEVEALLRGETTEVMVEGKLRRTRLLDPTPPLHNIADPIPTHVSAFGPKGRKLVAKLGAAWLGTTGTPESEAATLADMRAAWKEAGRDPAALHSALVCSGTVLAEGEAWDSPRARAQAAAQAAVAFHALAESYGTLHGDDADAHFPFKDALDAYRKVYATYPPEERHLYNHRGHMMRLRPDETHISGEIIKAFTLTGTKAELVDRLRGMRDAGYSQLVISMPPGQEDDMLEGWSDLFASL
jgi:5,10-methylenetetrahydromethanopterin reductase